jgi:hypothetical protein
MNLCSFFLHGNPFYRKDSHHTHTHTRTNKQTTFFFSFYLFLSLAGSLPPTTLLLIYSLGRSYVCKRFYNIYIYNTNLHVIQPMIWLAHARLLPHFLFVIVVARLYNVSFSLYYIVTDTNTFIRHIHIHTQTNKQTQRKKERGRERSMIYFIFLFF